MDKKPGPVTVYTKDPVGAILKNSVSAAPVQIAICNDDDLADIDKVKDDVRTAEIETTPPRITVPYPDEQPRFLGESETVALIEGDDDLAETIDEFNYYLENERSLNE